MGRSKREVQSNGDKNPFEVLIPWQPFSNMLTDMATLAPKKALPACLSLVVLRVSNGKLSAAVTDLETIATCSVEVECPAGAEFTAVVNADQLARLVRPDKKSDAAGSKTVTAMLRGRELSVTVDGIETSIAIFDITDEDMYDENIYRALNVKNKTTLIAARDCKKFQKSLEWIELAMSNDATRIKLNGIWIDPKGKRLVSTDAHRLHLVDDSDLFTGDLPDEKDGDVIVSTTAVKFAIRIMKRPGGIELAACREVGTTDRFLLISFKEQSELEWEVFTRLIDGQFPAVDQVVPDLKDMTAVSMDVVDLQKCLRRMDKMKCINAMQFTQNDGKLRMETRDSDGMKLTVSIPMTGKIPDEAVPFGLNRRYLRDTIGNRKLEDVVVYFPGDNLSPLRVKRDADGFAIIMPMRIDEKFWEK